MARLQEFDSRGLEHPQGTAKASASLGDGMQGSEFECIYVEHDRNTSKGEERQLTSQRSGYNGSSGRHNRRLFLR